MRAKQPGRAVEIELLSTLAPTLAEVGSESLVAPQAPHRVGDLLGVVGVEEQAGVADEIRQTGRVGGGDRHADGERLADREAPALEPAREDEAARQLVEGSQLQRADETREESLPLEPKLRAPPADRA